MIVMDKPILWPRKPGVRLPPGESCHLVSSLPGPEGTTELLAFAKRIGMRAAWLQKPGDATEHFDLFGSRIERARTAGATLVDRLQFSNILRAKRGLPPRDMTACRAEILPPSSEPES